MYLGDFDNFDQMIGQFQSPYGGYAAASPIDTTGIEVLLAVYQTGSYEGRAFVLFKKDGELFEVNGYHCSCYGLEGQWEPEPTTIAALRHRLTEGTLGKGDYWQPTFYTELNEILTTLEEEG